VLQKTYERYRDRGLVVLGVDVNDFRQDARRFMGRYGVTYPVVYDGKGSTVGKWGVRGFPETFFVDRTGKLVGERIDGAVDIERNRDAFQRGVALALGDAS
jgi:cytochrome c biogenesis protein CcmG/thiol:disulfide interchange protein DsbE